jgi:hypothetical protein
MPCLRQCWGYGSAGFAWCCPAGSGSVSQRYGSGSFSYKCVERTKKKKKKKKIIFKALDERRKIMCLRVSYKKKSLKFFFASLKSLKKGVGSVSQSTDPRIRISQSEVRIRGSRSVSQRYGSADPDPHQNFTDPQH